MPLNATFQGGPELSASFAHQNELNASFNPNYSGPYIVTPSKQTQTLETVNLRMVQNVIVNPIPNSFVGWKLIKSETTATISTTSTSAASATAIGCGTEIVTASKIVWVHVRDIEGPRNGYFFGADSFFVNSAVANSPNSAFTVPACVAFSYNNNAYAATSGQYGVYGYSISATGSLNIRRRYHSSYSRTINSKFKIDVYVYDLPTGVVLF